MEVRRNDPCPCGSGLSYGRCHFAINHAPEDEKYDLAQQLYAEIWTPSADHYFDRGIYHWLASMLEPVRPARVLDIGCGTGHGVLALYEVFGVDLEVVALDENLACLREAKERIQSRNLPVELLTRFSPRELSPIGYVHDIAPLTVEAGARCVLVESDVVVDPYLERWLEEENSFDAVTLWLTGTHTYRQHSAASHAAEIGNDEEHRLFVQGMAHRLAATALRPGGVLQISDRGMAQVSEIDAAELLDRYCGLAPDTSLRPESAEFRGYDDPASSMPMVTRAAAVDDPGFASLEKVLFVATFEKP